MIKTVMFLPARFNDGQPVPRRAWTELEAQLVTFGGFTRGGAVTGVWASGAARFTDRNRPYAVALASWQQFAAWLAVVAWAQTRWQQEAMSIEVQGQPEIIDFRYDGS